MRNLLLGITLCCTITASAGNKDANHAGKQAPAKQQKEKHDKPGTITVTGVIKDAKNQDGKTISLTVGNSGFVDQGLIDYAKQCGVLKDGNTLFQVFSPDVPGSGIMITVPTPKADAFGIKVKAAKKTPIQVNCTVHVTQGPDAPGSDKMIAIPWLEVK